MNIESLPDDLLETIFSNLNNRSIVQFIQGNSRLYEQFSYKRKIFHICVGRGSCCATFKEKNYFRLLNLYKQLSLTLCGDRAEHLNCLLTNFPIPIEVNQLRCENILIASIVLPHFARLQSLVLAYTNNKNESTVVEMRRVLQILRENGQSLELKRLSIKYFDESILPLPFLPELEELRMFIPRRLTSASLQSYQNLQKITIFKCNCANIDIGLFKGIRSVELDNCDGIEDVSMLADNYSVEVKFCPLVHDFTTGFGVNSSKIAIMSSNNIRVDFRKFKRVNDLLIKVYRANFVTEEIASDSIPNTLQSASFHYYLPLTLSTLTNIRHLVLRCIPGITTLHGLGGLRQVLVEIGDCPNITDFSALQNTRHVIIENCECFQDCLELSGVKHLRLSQCSNVKNIGKSTILQNLELYDCHNIRISAMMKNLKVLEFNKLVEPILKSIRDGNHEKILYKSNHPRVMLESNEKLISALQDRYIPTHETLDKDHFYYGETYVYLRKVGC